MNSRLPKELRPLALPWVGGLLTGGLLPLLLHIQEPDLATLFFIAFGASVALLSALPFGTEFQLRTLPLLLSQPCERTRIWAEKMLALLGAGALLVLVHWRLLSVFGPAGTPESLLIVLFLTASVCAAGFWISATRSILRGTLLSIACQAVVFLALAAVAAKLYGRALPLLNISIPQILLGSLIYCAGFLWLGREFWKRRPLVLLTVLGLTVLSWRLSSYYGEVGVANPWSAEGLIQAMFLLATLCSAGFWTLVARSTVGGMVLSVAVQFLVVLVLAALIGRTSYAEGPKLVGVICAVAGTYSILFLWLGWRKFLRLEMREAQAAEGVALSASVGQPRWWAAWLVCRAQGSFANLLRKELQLLRPIFFISLGFVVCWVVVLVLHLLKPEQGFNGLLDLLICFYIPLQCLLAGCMSLGEEKTLGLAAWHLSLPVSAGRQWLAKLGAGLVLSLVFGLGLPLVLTYITGALAPGVARAASGVAGFWAVFAGVGPAMFLLGFWAATLETSTVRAALAGVIALGLLWGCAVLGFYCAHQFSGLQSGLLAWVAPENPELRAQTAIWFALGLFLVIVVGVTLLQSFYQFRRLQADSLGLLRRFLALAACTALAAFWCTDLVISAANGAP